MTVNSILSTAFDVTALQAFHEQFLGAVILPEDADYEAARKIWNGIIDKYPAVIVRPVNADDVARAVNFAREQELLISVRGGGHNVAGHATNDGGIVIDLVAMKKIEVDPVTRIARAQGGTTWGDLDAATQVYGLAAPGGVVSKTGIAGLTLGGGYGWLRNKYGLSCDNLIAAELVTANGQQVRASATENADLLWGLRGGGGNFGVVTTFEYQLYPVGPEVAMAFVVHDGEGENMSNAIRAYRDYSETAPDEVSSLLACAVVPPGAEQYPEALYGRHIVIIGAMYSGDVQQGQAVLQPLRDFAQPLADLSGVVPYVNLQQFLDADYPDGMRYYWKSINLTQLDDEVIDLISAQAKLQPAPHSTTDLWHIGGAVKRASAEDSAFYGRHAGYLLNMEANWHHAEEDEVNIHWVRHFIDVMQPFSDGTRYLNFAGLQEEGDAMMRDAFGPRYERLAALKRKYDPNNLFRLNQNVKPETN